MAKKADLWSNFQIALQREGERLPEGKGWLTAKEIMARFKVGHCKFYRIIKTLPAERFDGYVLANGRFSRRTWYRPT